MNVRVPARPGSTSLAPAFQPIRGGTLQRRCACGGATGLGGGCAQCRRKRALPGSAAGAAPPLVHDVLTDGGSPLPDGLQRAMGASLGADFSQVRVHTDRRAAASAAAVRADAYTVGSHIVFGAGRFAPASAGGRKLLAHELAHVIQQGGQPAAANGPLRVAPAASPLEAAADKAAAGADRNLRPSTLTGQGVPGSPTTGVVQRQEATTPTTPTLEAEAERAEFACDLSTLCRLRFRHPEVVTPARVAAAARQCRPSQTFLGDPCLSIFTLPQAALAPIVGAEPAGGTAAGPRRPGAPATAGASSGGLGGLSDLLTFNFNAGPVRFTVQLPEEAKAHLPISLSAGRSLTITLTAEASGTFSLNIRLDALPHILLSWRTAVDVSGETVSTGLTLTTRRTVCRATPSEAIRRDIQSKGEALTRLVNEYQAQIATLAFEEQRDKLIEIASQVADIYESAQRAEEPCRQQPVLEFSVGTTIPFGEPEATGPLAPRPGPSFGASLTLRIPGT